MKKALCILIILLAGLNSQAVEITSQDIDQVITEQDATHAVVVVLVEVQ